ncbi:MAG: hypothetical protein ACR2H3_11200 [Acidimicrobiales bacterium]
MSSIRSLASLAGVPRRIVAITALTSIGAAAVASFQGWPLWAGVALVALTWVPVFAIELVWAYRHFEFIAAFYLLVVTQMGHYGEHAVQMVQIHVLHRSGAAARGVFGALDVEWLHLGFNTWVLLGALAMLWRYRANRWLWPVACGSPDPISTSSTTRRRRCRCWSRSPYSCAAPTTRGWPRRFPC